MKIGIMSDSHDNVPAVEAAVRLFTAEGVAAVLHAGDYVAPFALPPLQALEVPVYGVLGNNDGERVGLTKRFTDFGWVLQPKFAFISLGGRQIAMHHEQEPVEALAGSGLYHLVVYGHTHELDLRTMDNGCQVVNPGETGGWLSGRRTVVTADLDTMAIQVHDLEA